MAYKVVLVADASDGLGARIAQTVAHDGHTVYAGLSQTAAENALDAEVFRRYSRDEGVDVRPLKLDVRSQASVDHAVASVVAEHGRIDVVVHNAGQMAFGPAEAFTPAQFAELYDIHVLSAQRVNRATLPFMRSQGHGLLIWISSSSAVGGTPPYLAPYFAAKAALDALAVQYARELTRWGIETSIIVPGPSVRGLDSLIRAEAPIDAVRIAAYEAGPYAGVENLIRSRFAAFVPVGADPGPVAGAIAGLIETPFGQRPFRVHVDPSGDGGSIAFPVIDRLREEMLRRLGLADLLTPAVRPTSQTPATDPPHA